MLNFYFSAKVKVITYIKDFNCYYSTLKDMGWLRRQDVGNSRCTKKGQANSFPEFFFAWILAEIWICFCMALSFSIAPVSTSTILIILLNIILCLFHVDEHDQGGKGLQFRISLIPGEVFTLIARLFSDRLLGIMQGLKGICRSRHEQDADNQAGGLNRSHGSIISHQMEMSRA